MKIESIIRRKNGTHPKLGDITYHFLPTPDDARHLADVSVPEHIQRFLSITEAYRIPLDSVETPPAAPVAQVPAQELVLGSYKLPSVVLIGEVEVQLGDIVLEALDVSELSIAEWNALPAEEREQLIQDELDLRRGSLLEGKITQPEAASETALQGSDWEPTELTIGDVTYKTVDIVKEAFQGSGLDVAAWNALDSTDIEIKMNEVVAAKQLEQTKEAKPAEPAAEVKTEPAKTEEAKPVSRQAKAAATRAANKAKAAK